ALVPFHFWLPGAMAAPTPVSAYLHAAAMVKAGIFLVARLAPGFAGSGSWRPTVLILGGATLLIGGWAALKQTDLILLLAYGTVSLLGFLTMLVGAGTRASALSGLTMVLAHALFKACLFLIVGIIDKVTGTRDIRELSGLGRAHPVLAVAAVIAAASMAGLPPTLGFVGKEAALTGFVPGSGADAWLLGLSAAGAALTFAYSGRLIWGAFADKPGSAPTTTTPAGRGICAGPVALAALSLAAGLFAGRLDNYIAPYALSLPELGGAHDEIEHLALWHGITPALLLTALIMVAGAVLVIGRDSVEWLQERTRTGLDAQRTYRRMMRGVDRIAVEVTGATQRGSQPLYLGIILVTAVVILGISAVAAFADGLWPDNLILWDTPAQAVVGALTVAGAVLAARSRRRLRAVILVGVTGYGTAMLFLLGGAPDLALTQVLVETITLVVFVLVLRRLPPFFSDRPLAASRWIRLAIGLAVGGGVSLVALIAVGAREAKPVSGAFPQEAVDYGGGKNIVNVALVDIRAWDTMGEISVLVVAATGVASLTFLSRTMTRRVRVIPASAPEHDTHPGRSSWLATSAILDPARRSVIFEVVTRLIFHTIMLFSLYLLFSGHNHPGGGFAGGLVAGLALTVRYLAGGRYELNEAAPIDAGVLLGLGLFVATGAGLAPLAFGGSVLESAILDAHLPIFGEAHVVTSAIFDIGVYLVVIGLVLDILRSLGAEIDRQIEDGDTPVPTDDAADAAAVAR
ncbi:MAG: Na+/H+ antiporter subunit, partial [Jatrophihabitantaceae bacterium]|nr:Na+/H+ antiporter subunit [Jatrophihabitantaceae bacterium]